MIIVVFAGVCRKQGRQLLKDQLMLCGLCSNSGIKESSAEK